VDGMDEEEDKEQKRMPSQLFRSSSDNSDCLLCFIIICYICVFLDDSFKSSHLKTSSSINSIIMQQKTKSPKTEEEEEKDKFIDDYFNSINAMDDCDDENENERLSKNDKNNISMEGKLNDFV
jgi:regulator of PEP synthase PpsR (kinase-PPPase family)